MLIHRRIASGTGVGLLRRRLSRGGGSRVRRRRVLNLISGRHAHRRRVLDKTGNARLLGRQLPRRRLLRRLSRRRRRLRGVATRRRSGGGGLRLFARRQNGGVPRGSGGGEAMIRRRHHRHLIHDLARLREDGRVESYAGRAGSDHLRLAGRCLAGGPLRLSGLLLGLMEMMSVGQHLLVHLLLIEHLIEIHRRGIAGLWIGDLSGGHEGNAVGSRLGRILRRTGRLRVIPGLGWLLWLLLYRRGRLGLRLTRNWPRMSGIGRSVSRSGMLQ